MALKELIEYSVKKLVESPEKVVITEVPSEGKTIIQVLVAPQDLGRVIGTDGRTFRALRSLLNILSTDKRYDLVVDIAV